MKTTTLILQLLVNRLTFSGKSWYFSQALDYLLWFNITVNYFDEYLTFKIEKFRTTYVQSSSNNKDNIYWKIKEYHPSLPSTSPTYCPVWSGCLSLIRQTQQLGLHDGSLLPSGRESITYTGGTQHGDDTYCSHHHWVVTGSHSCI